MTRGFSRLYGAHPLHLIAHLAAFLVAGWAIAQIVGGGAVINWIAWFIGAALLHDLVLLPLYSASDRAVLRTVSPRRARPPRPDAPRALNHLRVPAAISGILLLVYFPLILGLASDNYRADTGHALAGYTRNWLLITAGVFAASALVYGVRVLRHRPPRPHRPPRHPPPRPREQLRR